MLQLELYVWILMELPPAKKWISVELLYFLQVLHLKSVEFIWFTGPMIESVLRRLTLYFDQIIFLIKLGQPQF